MAKHEKKTKSILPALLVILIVLGAGFFLFNYIEPKMNTIGKIKKVEQETFKLGTIVRITLYGTDEELLNRCMTEAMSEISSYENLFSANIPSSDISMVNSKVSGDIYVNRATASIMHDAIGFARMTEGAFDPTIGSVVSLWKIGTDYAKVPDKKDIAEALKTVDYTKISVKENKIAKGKWQKIDLGAIAKGWIADRICDRLRERGVNSAIVDLGGNIAVIGKSQKHTAWRLGIQHPSKPRGEYFAAIEAEDTSLVTSGAYERFFEENGVRYHHIFDPKTGRPAESDLASVTVVSKNSAKADALSTALFVMGYDKSVSFLAQDKYSDIDVIFVQKDLKKVHITKGLKNKIKIKDVSMTLETAGEQ